MIVAKLSDGRLAVLLKQNAPVLFDTTRSDWCLCYTNGGRSGHIDCSPRKRDLFWVKSTCIAKLFEFEDIL